MASNVPTVKQIAWISLIPQLTLTGIIIYIYYIFQNQQPVIYGGLTYIGLSILLRNILAKDHRDGLRLAKQENFTDAINKFEKSVDFFTKNSWLDKYRFLTLLSSSKMTYKEMSLCNIAFCYSQTNNGKKAKEYYEQIIKEFPENGLAIAGLRLINSVENSK
jgi:tetratricopeptide (TPR) repeat protein